MCICETLFFHLTKCTPKVVRGVIILLYSPILDADKVQTELQTGKMIRTEKLLNPLPGPVVSNKRAVTRQLERHYCTPSYDFLFFLFTSCTITKHSWQQIDGNNLILGLLFNLILLHHTWPISRWPNHSMSRAVVISSNTGDNLTGM